MIRHTVLWKLKEENKKENMALLKEQLLALSSKIDVIREIEVGENALDKPNAYDFVLQVVFDSFDDLEKYIVHEDHKKVGEFVKQVITHRASADYVIE